jgi:hypothetical protein
MFDSVGAPLNIIFIIGLVIWAGLFVFGFIFGKLSEDRTARVSRRLKLGMSILLVLMALIWWLAGTAGTTLAALGLFIFLGMLFGFFGDVSLSDDIVNIPQPVIFGIVAFLIGHVFYILGYLHLARTLSVTDVQSRMMAHLFYQVVGIALWAVLVRSPKVSAVLNIGSLVYTIFLAAMTAYATWLALQEPRLATLAFGAILFLISDVILGMRLLRGTTFLIIRDVVWVMYIIGQALIVFSVGTALQLLGAG